MKQLLQVKFIFFFVIAIKIFLDQIMYCAGEDCPGYALLNGLAMLQTDCKNNCHKGCKDANYVSDLFQCFMDKKGKAYCMCCTLTG